MTVRWRLVVVVILVAVVSVEAFQRSPSDPGTWADVLLALAFCGGYVGASHLDHRKEGP